jgi:hypothetical protein
MLTEEFAAKHFGFRPEPHHVDDPLAQVKRLTRGPGYLSLGERRLALQDREVDVHKGSAGWSGTIDGWLGLPVLAQFFCLFDFGAWELSLHESHRALHDLSFAARDGWSIAPISHDPDPFLAGRLAGLPGRWMVDTGRTNTAVYLDAYLRAGLPARELEGPDPDFWVAGWDCRGFYADSVPIEIGGVTLPNEAVAVTDYKPGRDYNQTAVSLWLGDIGTEALSFFPLVAMTTGAEALWFFGGGRGVAGP